MSTTTKKFGFEEAEHKVVIELEVYDDNSWSFEESFMEIWNSDEGDSCYVELNVAIAALRLAGFNVVLPKDEFFMKTLGR